MVSLLLALWLVISSVLLLCRSRTTALISLLLTTAFYFLIANGMLSKPLLFGLQNAFTDPPVLKWQSKNAIILLGAGTVTLPVNNEVIPSAFAYSRITKAASLYLSCVKQHTCKIIVSGGDALKTGRSEAEVYEEVLLQLGVKQADIIIENKSMNTYQNAQFTSKLIKQEQYGMTFLVTSGIHLKRSLLYFNKFDIHAIPVASDYLKSGISLFPHGYNMMLADTAMHEYLGILRFYVYERLGWNK